MKVKIQLAVEGMVKAAQKQLQQPAEKAYNRSLFWLMQWFW
jgi:hypothetical protein